MNRLTAFLLLAVGMTAAFTATATARPLVMSHRQDSPEKDEAKGVIKGTVQKNGRTLKNSLVRVEIVGLGDKFSKKVNSDGTFEFTAVPDGTYVLKASGTFKNAQVQGELKDVKPAEAEKAEAVAVAVE